MPPDVAAFAAEVDGLAGLRVETLSVGQLMRLVAEADSATARLQGVVSRAVGELASRGGGLVPDADGASLPLPAWLRDVTHVSGRDAGRQVRTSQALRELPAVSDAVVDGAITLEHGRVLARLVGLVDRQVLLDSQERCSRSPPAPTPSSSGSTSGT